MNTKKEIIFAGCSFTWGQGLWSYDESHNFCNRWTLEDGMIPKEVEDLRKKYRFVEKVGNYLGSVNVLSPDINGGNDYGSLSFINENFKPGITKYIFLQTSQLFRNSFSFEMDGIDYEVTSPIHERNLMNIYKYENGERVKVDDKYQKTLINYLIKNNITIENFEEIFSNKVINKIKLDFNFYQSTGAKFYILCWTNELVDKIKSDSILSDSFIPLLYDDVYYNCIDDLQKKFNKFRIDKDPIIKCKTVYDEHPSKECHEIIANSIILKLKKDNKNL